MRSLALLSTILTAVLPVFSQARDLSAHTGFLSLTVLARDGSYELRMPSQASVVLRARVSVMIDEKWIGLTQYPRHRLSETFFENALGSGHQITVTSSGLKDQPDLSYTIRLYDALPFGELEAEVSNRTSRAMTLQAIRLVEAIGKPLVELGAAEFADRVLSDSFGEAWQGTMPIDDLGKAPHGMHRAVDSQLIYNRESGRSLFVGALTSERFLTIMHLRAQPEAAGARIASFTVDCTGTTEVQKGSLSGENRIELTLPLGPGSKLSSERLMFATGRDYHAQLEAYGAAIRQLHHARVEGENLMGWWSWLPYYHTINEGAALTTAQWLAQHLKGFGYEFLQIDEGYNYARGEYTTPNAAQFPRGMRGLTQEITRLGLKLGIWAAPFYVGNDSWVYANHKDWLVHNALGEPLPLGHDAEVGEDLFVLDPTHPGAQEYLRQTYRTVVREWGMRYIKLDFMTDTTVEGYYCRPHTTALEAQRIGLEVIREAVGDDVLLDKDDSPMLNTVGLVDEGRIAGDAEHSYPVTKMNAVGIAARYYMHRNFFVNDPDAFSVQEAARPAAVVTGTPQGPLSLNEAESAIAIAAVSGGMFEIGDDLPTLGLEPDRLALVTNPDLLQMAKLGRASVPLDLLTYSSQDEQPSIFFLREDERQSMLAVFNWTEHPRSRVLKLADLGFPAGAGLRLHDVLSPERALTLDGGAIRIADQPARSVRLIKITDESRPPAPPTIAAEVPAKGQVGETLNLSAVAAEDGVPALAYRWDFGDGIVVEGKTQQHAYTVAGTFTVRLIVYGLDGVPARETFSIAVAGEARQGPSRRYVDPTG